MGEWSHWGYCVTLLTLVGCQQTLRLGPAELRNVVQQYGQKGEVEVKSGSKRFAITSAQEPQLRLVTDTCRKVSDSDTCEPPQAPLADVRIEPDDTVVLPNTQPVRLSEVTYADVVVEGRAAGRWVARGTSASRWCTPACKLADPVTRNCPPATWSPSICTQS